MADSTGNTASSAGKKSNTALVLGGIVIVFAILAGAGWYLQGSNQAGSAVADANKAAADAAQAAAAASNAAMAQSQQAMAAANQAMQPGGMQPPPPGGMQPPPPGAVQAPPPAPMAAPAPRPDTKPKAVASKTDSSGAKSAPAPAHTSPTAAKVAECKRIGNLFERESCMWKACSNKWGKDGCPEYQKPPSGSAS
jgi:hypothetical protein